MVNSVKAPWWVYLITQQHHNAILLNRFDIRIFFQTLKCRVIKHSGKAIHRSCVHRQNLRTSCGLCGCKRARCNIIFQRDDVLIIDWHTHQVGKIWAEQATRFVDTQHAIEFNQQHIFVFTQANYVSVVEFGNKALDSRRIHIADRITKTCFFSNFAIEVDAIFKNHDVITGCGYSRSWRRLNRSKYKWCKQRDDHQRSSAAQNHCCRYAHTVQYRLNPSILENHSRFTVSVGSCTLLCP